MSGIICTTLGLLLAGLGCEYFRATPDYAHALLITWEQLVALIIYQWLWVTPEINRMKFMQELEKNRGQ